VKKPVKVKEEVTELVVYTFGKPSLDELIEGFIEDACQKERAWPVMVIKVQGNPTEEELKTIDELVENVVAAAEAEVVIKFTVDNIKVIAVLKKTETEE